MQLYFVLLSTGRHMSALFKVFVLTSSKTDCEQQEIIRVKLVHVYNWTCMI